jgi:hypothetical protein
MELYFKDLRDREPAECPSVAPECLLIYSHEF